MPDNSIICELPNQLSGNAGVPDVVRYQCVRCGQFDINHAATVSIGAVAERDRPLISDWVWEQSKKGVS
jgi:hypothetical protein